MDDSLVLRLMVAAGLLVAVGGAAGAVVLRVAAGPSPPPVRPAGKPWPGTFVTLAFFLFPLTLFLVGLGQGFLQAIGFYRGLYGPGFPAELPEDPSAAEKAAATIRALWAHVLTFPVVLAVILALPRGLKVSNPFAGRGRAGAVAAGYLTWLITTPAVYCVFVLANLGHMKLTGRGPEKHPLTALGDLAGWREWALLVLQAVVIAPVVEEWVFRGVLLPWLARTRADDPDSPLTVPPARRPVLVHVAAVGTALILTLGMDAIAHPGKTWNTLADPAQAVASYAIPAAFFLLLIPLDFVLPRLGRLRRHLRIHSRQQVRAILASAALFAAFHANVWPSPVPLLFLAMGLGYLYLRTRSLIGPIVVHALFNAVSAVYLVLGGPA